MPEQLPGRDEKPTGRWSWFPRFLVWRQQRVRSQVRLLALAVLVGIVAGLGAIFFYVATRGVEHYALNGLTGYQPSLRPAGETNVPGLVDWHLDFRPWLLLIVPTIGGLISGWLVYTLAPRPRGMAPMRSSTPITIARGRSVPACRW